MSVMREFFHRNKVQAVYCVGWVGGLVYQISPTAASAGSKAAASIVRTFL